MNTKLLSFFRAVTNRSEKDVFKSTQGRLTRMYSGLLMLFLILFIVIVYSVLYVIILKNQEHELDSLVNQEASFIENYLMKNEQRDLHGIQNQEIVFAGVNQYFYYVVNANGELILGNEADRRLRPDLLNLVKSSFQNEIRKVTLHVESNLGGRGNKGEFHPHEDAHDIRLMVASHSIYNNGQFIGQLYIGKDISFAYQLFHLLLMILVALGIVFFGVATFMSVVMSKRAMIPISGAFSRQREFVADASHELRTPLSVLLSSIDAMEMTIEPVKEEEGDFVGRLLSNMRQEVKRMTNLVSDLLTLARSDSNTIETKTESFDFRAQADKAMESVNPLAASKQISLNLQAPATLMATGDPQRLSQLLYILLDNAIKYTPNGGEVQLSLSEEARQLCIKVQDTGIGIKQEDQNHIFERFYRADKSRSRQMGGHGLGLSIAKWIVDTHGGTIQLSSEVGKGSTFVIRIPQ
ncbi:sensor histidine kinase [Neobacillus ginsengisoli]|uniref:histidine kinase n=1 Tax=Neobacillus ginsengisoli TaxID=904295 RepID=A0ABT9XUI8_9BACI|nr:ATP-binding protein [Neobacillus ginsengisoli]MDQ0199179.1 signal transduction histidine kinase [Neobacillus ginsengisoli]